MYFACWRALSAPTRTTTTAMQSAMQIIMSLQKKTKIQEYLLLHVYPPGLGLLWLYWLLVSSLAAHDGDATPGAGAGTAASGERRPGSGHLDAGTLGGERWDVTSSLIIHYGADTRRRHIHTISSGGLIMSPKTESDNQEEKEELTEAEMEFVTSVFKSFETGLREATIYPKVSLTFQ